MGSHNPDGGDGLTGTQRYRAASGFRKHHRSSRIVKSKTDKDQIENMGPDQLTKRNFMDIVGRDNGRAGW